MRTTFIAILGFLAVALAAQSASAQSQERWPRWYVGLSGSLVWVQDSDVSGLSPARSIDFDQGYGAGVSLGYMPPVAELGNARFEFEAYWRNSDADTKTVGGVHSNANGELTSYAYMVNAYYDFRNDSQWVPYLGVGLGWANVELDKTVGLGATADDDVVFAYQGMVGIGYEPTTIPNTIWSIGYRYFGSQDPEFGNVTADLDTHNLEAGVKMRF